MHPRECLCTLKILKMSNTLLKIVAFSLSTALCFCEYQCESNNNCDCFQNKNNRQFFCPMTYEEVGGFVVKVTKDKEISIECHKLAINTSQLPKIEMDKVNLLYIRSCPLVEFGLTNILSWFSVQRVGLLEIEFANFSAGKLNRHHFAGFQSLGHMKLNRNDLRDMDINVFDNTPNILSLELQENHIDLHSFSFKSSSILYLDISSNNLTSVPLLKQLKSLVNLQLWGNEITQIRDEFSAGGSLQVLDLSANRISNISRDAFQFLKLLTHINLANNRLGYLDDDLFRFNTKIELIKLAENPLLHVSGRQFADFPHLKEVDLSSCNLVSISENAFKNSGNLTVISLQNNVLNSLPETVFHDLINLEKLYLNDNGIETLGKLFWTLRSLTELHLQNNNISVIEENSFGDLIRLEELNLESNQIVRIHPRGFGHEKLRKINLSKNLYAANEANLFKDALEIEEINFSHNLITRFEDVIDLSNKVNLKNLDLSYNHITTVFINELQSVSDVRVNLGHNFISTVNFDNIGAISDLGTSIISLDNNPIVCDCNNYPFVKYMRNEMTTNLKSAVDIQGDNLICASPNNLINTTLTAVPLASLQCVLKNYTECPKQCTCSWRPFDSTHVIDCSNKNLTELPTLANDLTQIELRLEHNSLGPELSFAGLGLNITRLYLSSNQLSGVSGFPETLQVLHLDNNRFTRLGFEVLEILNQKQVFEVYLHNNPWICDCKAKNLTAFIRQFVHQVDSDNVFCVNSTHRLIDLTSADLCMDYTLHIFLSISLIIMIIIITVAVYYCYRKQIKIWLFAHKLCLCCVSEDDMDEDKLYDAFVSYSHKDEEFVVGDLIRILETDGYSLCLHYRDFVPGEFICDQIIRSVEESRRTVVVLSRNFLESVWAKVEFRVAHSKAMCDNRGRVIIIMYGNVDVNQVEEELQNYLKTNTYVKWGDPFFWNKLRYALPHRRCITTK